MRISDLSEELQATKAELGEKRQLNEKLELDLLQMESHKPSANDCRSLTPSGTRESNGIADLDLDGKRSTNVSGFVEGRQFDLVLTLHAFPGIVCEKHTHSICLIGRYVHFAHCDEPTRSFQTTKR